MARSSPARRRANLGRVEPGIGHRYQCFAIIPATGMRFEGGKYTGAHGGKPDSQEPAGVRRDGAIAFRRVSLPAFTHCSMPTG